MQRIRLNRALLTELSRCERSFVMSLFWHGLDNESLQQKGGLPVETDSMYNTRREHIYNLDGIAQSIANANEFVTIDCTNADLQGKLDDTYRAIEAGGSVVIVDGALEGGTFVVGFSILVIREDGYWEVYHQSTKSYGLTNKSSYKKALDSACSDAAPLMYVLAEYYSDVVKRFAVIASNKNYLTPYPNPITGEIDIDPNEAMYYLDLDMSTENIANYLGYEDPEAKVYEIQQALSQNPFWIPDSIMLNQMAKCNDGGIGYPCPFRTYCMMEMEEQCPDSVRLYLDGATANMLIKRGINTMTDLLELSYDDPVLDSLYTGQNGNTIEILLRELRAYEASLDDVEDEVKYQFG